MALGVREMLLVIRARDEASRVMGRLGTTMRNMDKDAKKAAQDAMNRGGALVSLGAGVTAIGGAGLAFFDSTTKAATKYEQAARLAWTQTDGLDIKLQDLEKTGMDVAKRIPVPLEDTQKALYTIFSTIDTDMPGARKLLESFSQAAVAGQTDLENASQGSLQILNAWKLGAQGVNRVNDVMFTLVKEGAGTYDQFIGSIGKAAPSAVRMGQSVEDLGGMLAFMTRNGLSAQMASTSAARAFDLLAQPKVIDRMKNYGVAVIDAQGQFRPMSDIVQDLGEKMADLSAPERAEALGNLFKGSGNNVQARRFFDLAVGGFKELNTYTDRMQQSSGAMDSAYDKMFKSPQSQMQLMNNRYEEMRVEVGQQLIPVKLKLMGILTDLLKAWDNLSPGVKRTIVWVGVAIAVFLTLAGIGTMLAGGIMILSGAAGTLGLSLLQLIGIASGVVIGIAAIGVGIYFVIKYHKEIWDWIQKVWGNLKQWIEDNKGAAIAIASVLGTILMPTFVRLGIWAVASAAKVVWSFVTMGAKAVWAGIQFTISAAKAVAGWVWMQLKAYWSAARQVASWAVTAAKAIWAAAVYTAQSAIIVAKWLWMGAVASAQALKQEAAWLLSTGAGMATAVASMIATAATFVARWVWMGAQALWNAARMAAAWVIAMGPIGWIIAAVVALVALIIANWDKVKKWTVGVFTTVINWLKEHWPLLLAIITGPIGLIVYWIVKHWDDIKRVFHQGVDAVVNFFKDLPGRVAKFITDFINGIIKFGGDMIHGLWDGIKAAGDWLLRKFGEFFGNLIPDWVKDMLGIGSPSRVFAEIGNYVGLGFANGVLGSAKQVDTAIRSLTGRVLTATQEFQRKHEQIMERIATARTALQRRNAARDLADLNRAYGTLTSGGMERALAVIAQGHAKLHQIAVARANIAKKITAANKQLTAAIKVRDKFAQDVASGIRDWATITNLDPTGGDLAEQMQTRLETIILFRENLQKLQKMGLSKTMYQQIVGAGIEKGGALAEALVADGQQSVTELSKIQAQIDQASKGLGTDASKVLYQAGVDAAAGLIKGLQAQSTALARAAKSIAGQLIAQVNAALGIRSPSAVFADVGHMMMKGMANGIIGGAKMAINAASNAAGMVADEFGGGFRPDFGGPPPAAGAMAMRPPVNLTVYTQEINPIQHATELGQLLEARVG